MATRVGRGAAEEVRALLPPGVLFEYNEAARIITCRLLHPPARTPRLEGRVVLLTAGTADLPVAEECRMTMELAGCDVRVIQDVGVAGLHRLLSRLEEVRAGDVVVVVAGMDGALPSVTAGLVDAPVIAVPTSVGYGAALGGVAPLLSMLIDNGFGAGMLAARIVRRMG
mmetsp:Transcript_65650/g.207692  ORF Transcript_65650/g.207692 Transcript_65650/m.207692 type:complete len:169 (+) Transcript_65650:216-722(+)